jgi:plastocyanin
MKRATLLFLATVLFACSSGTTAPADAGTAPTDASADAVAEASADAAPVENGCTSFVDRSADAASRKIQWDLSVATIPEHCMRIKAGQTVSWVAGSTAADFDAHPLVIYLSGGGGNPPTVDGSTGNATFAAPGLYGFACGIHPTMRGAILVE